MAYNGGDSALASMNDPAANTAETNVDSVGSPEKIRQVVRKLICQKVAMLRPTEPEMVSKLVMLRPTEPEMVSKLVMRKKQVLIHQ